MTKHTLHPRLSDEISEDVALTLRCALDQGRLIHRLGQPVAGPTG